MLEGLRGCYTVIRIVHQQFLDQILYFCAGVGYQFDDASSFDNREIEFHMGRVLLEIIKKCLIRRPKNIMYFVYLINFVISWEKRK